MSRLKSIILGLFAVLGLSNLTLAPRVAPAQTPPKGPATYTVEIRGHQYLVNGKPDILKIKGGDKVVWWNRTGTTHTATSDAGSRFMFDTKRIAPGAKSKAVTFPAGDYTLGYHCQIHPDMRGVVTVGNGDSGLSDSGLVAPAIRPNVLPRKQR
jgi:plastocyanin